MTESGTGPGGVRSNDPLRDGLAGVSAREIHDAAATLFVLAPTYFAACGAAGDLGLDFSGTMRHRWRWLSRPEQLRGYGRVRVVDAWRVDRGGPSYPHWVEDLVDGAGAFRPPMLAVDWIGPGDLLPSDLAPEPVPDAEEWATATYELTLTYRLPTSGMDPNRVAGWLRNQARGESFQLVAFRVGERLYRHDDLGWTEVGEDGDGGS